MAAAAALFSFRLRLVVLCSAIVIASAALFQNKVDRLIGSQTEFEIAN